MMRYHVGDRSRMSNPRMPAAIRSARPPAVAGQFYDTDPRRLQAEIEQLLATAPRQDASVRPKAIIAPHAGYRYSGQVAATAMAALSGYTATIERVILIHGDCSSIQSRPRPLPAAVWPGGPISSDLSR